jgi:hypothetical protein
MKNLRSVKILMIFSLCFGLSIGTFAQNNVFSKGDRVANLGIGIGSYLGGTGYSTKIPPISASIEYGVKDDLFDENSSLGIGGYIAYTSNQQEYTLANQTYGWDYSHFILGARGIVHYQWVEKLDTYGGLMLGYNVASSSSFGTNVANGVSASSVGGFAFSLFVGARYYFSDNIAAFGELGYGIAALQLGVALKF